MWNFHWGYATPLRTMRRRETQRDELVKKETANFVSIYTDKRLWVLFFLNILSHPCYSDETT